MATRSARKRLPAPARRSAGTTRLLRFLPTSATPGAPPASAAPQVRKAWEKRLASADAGKRGEFERRMRGDLPAALDPAISDYKKKIAAEKPKVATRKASEMALDVINPIVPETVGGSADLTPSNNTRSKDLKEITPSDFSGRYIHWGVREHGMAAALNGMALHGGLIPYSGTFLVFTDYCRPSIRLAALSGIRVVFVMTHDSIGLGEDGPTHQPIEHLAALRAIPNLNVFRPADVDRDGGMLAARLGKPEDARASSP